MFRKICTDVLCFHSGLNKQVASHKMRNAAQRFTNVIGSNRVDEKERTWESSKTNIVQSLKVL